jgi:hypothetical protein
MLPKSDLYTPKDVSVEARIPLFGGEAKFSGENQKPLIGSALA